MSLSIIDKFIAGIHMSLLPLIGLDDTVIGPCRGIVGDISFEERKCDGDTGKLESVRRDRSNLGCSDDLDMGVGGSGGEDNRRMRLR